MNPAQVVYEAVAGAPGRYFRCSRYGLMNVDACSRNFAQAPVVASEGRLTGCIGCQVGAHHSGTPNLATPDAGQNRCVRCQRNPTDETKYRGTRQGRVRMVQGGDLCVSCFNREREVIRGKNARGTKPRLQLDQKVVDYCVGDTVGKLRFARTTGNAEAFTRAERQVDGPAKYLLIAGIATVLPTAPNMSGAGESN